MFGANGVLYHRLL